MLGNEDIFEAITSSARDGIVLIDNFGKITYWNKAAENIFQYSSVEALGRDLHLTIVPKQYRETYIKDFEDFVKTGRGFFINKTIELQGLRKDGTIIPIELSGSKIKLKGKWNAAAMIRDVGERKLMEEKLKQSKADLIKLNRELKKKTEEKSKQLKESKDIYRLITENANDLISIVNKNLITEYINEEVFKKLLGYTNEDIIGKPALHFIHPEEIGKIKGLIRKGLKAGEGTAELRCIDKNGSFHWLEIRGKTFRNQDRETKAVFFARDITERKKAENLILEEIKKLKELDQIRRDFIASVSHELKIPLVIISGGSELLLNLCKEKLGEEELEIIELIEKGAKRLNSLINMILDISRLEYKKLELEKSIYDLSKIINECHNELKYIIKNRKIILSLDLPEKLILNIDKIRITQVIFNLLLNAIKNTPPNGKVKVLLQESEKWVEFSVSDTGIGLTEKELKKIFTRFGKIERIGKGLEYLDIRGVGFGLFFSKEIVKLHEGYIWADSEGRNKGSVFIVKLPI